MTPPDGQLAPEGAQAAQQPLPIADALSDLASADSLHERRDRVVECFRAALRYLGAVVLAVRAQYGPGPGAEPDQVRELVRGLRRRGLTDGQWVAVVRGLLRAWDGAAGAYPIPALAEAFSGRAKKATARAIDGLLEMRKSETVAHGATGRGAALAEVLARREPQLDELLARLSPAWRAARLVVPLAQPDETGDEQSAWLLHGYTPARGKWPRIRLASGVRVAPGEPVLVDPEGRPRVALHPVAMFRRPSPEAVEELFVLDGAKKRAARYVAFPSMAEHRENQVWQLLASSLLDDGDEAGDEPGIAGVARPYRGLASFGSEHAALFFGRERQAEALANRIRRHPMVTVTGPSGSGKSSLLFAGVLPLMDEVSAASVRPGADPMKALERSLRAALGEWQEAADLGEVLAERPETLGVYLERWARSRERSLLLVIDQAEELFTLCASWEVREAFALAVASVGLDADGPTRVVLSLREDFFARLSTLEPVRGVYNRQVEVVTTPVRDDLLRILYAPARLFGYEFEEASLVEEMVDSVAGEPAALAMLQFCADQMWERRDRSWKRLTGDSYRAIGGVEGALAAHAEATLGGLTPGQVGAARSIFLRLVTAEGTRAVVAREELVGGAGSRGEAERVLDRLVDARLVTTRESAEERDAGSALVELVHEALLRHWQRLRTWLDEDAEFVRVRARVGVQAGRWVEEGWPVDLLFSEGKPLIETAELLEARRDSLSPNEIDFAEASIARGRRRRRIKRAAIVGLAMLAILAGSFGAFAWWARGEAERQSGIAARNADEADARAISLLEEQGRVELEDGKPMRALVYLSEAYTRGGDSVALRGLIADAMRPLDALEHTLEGHTDIVWSAAFAADGARLVTASGDSTARIWNAESGALELSLAGHGGPVKSARLSRDGTRVITASDDATARIWDAETGALLHTLAGHKRRVVSARFSPDGSRVATCGWDAEPRVWDARTGELLFGLAGHDSDVWVAVFSPNGERIVTASADGTARTWEAATGKPVAVLSGHEARVNDAVFSPDSARVLTTSDDRSARIWNADTGESLAVFRGHEREVGPAAFSPDGALAVTGGRDCTARVWDVKSGEERAALIGHRDWIDSTSQTKCRVDSVAFHPDEARVLTGGVDGTARVWEARSGSLLATLEGHTGSVSRAVYSPDGARIVTASLDSTARLWRDTSGKLVATARLAAETASDPWQLPVAASFTASGHSVVAVNRAGAARIWNAEHHTVSATFDGAVLARASPDGARIVTADSSGALRVSRTADGSVAVELRPRHPHVMAASFCAGGARLATGGGDLRAGPERWCAEGACAVRVWDLENGALLATLADAERGHRSPVRAVACAPGGERVASVDASGTVAIWNAGSGELEHSLVAKSEMAGALFPTVQFSPDGTYLIAAVADSKVELWEVATGRLLHTLEGMNASFGPEGLRVLSVDGDGPTAMSWDARTGELLASFQGHEDGVVAASFDRAGQRVVTAGKDRTARVWEASTGRLLAVLGGHAEGLTAAEFGPNDEQVVTAAGDGTVRIWDVRVEWRAPARIAAVVAERAPWRLIDGRLVPKPQPVE